MLEIQDEYGESWLVYDQDPAAPLVKKLTGYIDPVFPRETIVSGKLVEVPMPDLEELVYVTPVLARLIVRQYLLWDCVQYLKEGGDVRNIPSWFPGPGDEQPQC